ncbi:MAG: efflux RND transporter permease subunit, partial [Planctomycetes bacterium]|nr:efflux RND transporter permease subunit [Planctomycetota bacterium]
RSPLLPDVPTIAEAGVPGYEVSGYLGIFAPVKTANAIVKKLNGDIATVVGRKVREDVATKFRERDRQIEVLVRVDEAQSRTPEDLGELVVNPGGAVPTRLRSVAAMEKREGPSEIRRIGHQRAVVISAHPVGTDLAGTVAAVRSRLSSLPPHADVSYMLSGQNREMEVSSRSLTTALWLSLFLVYLIMASQFESLLHPFVIMFTMPLGRVGVVGACAATATPFSVLVYIGLIVLAGIVVNNAIVLVDCANRLRTKGASRTEAITQAGRMRLRPILMTTLTTVLGLLPMALGLGDGSEIRQPLALTILAGLSSATILTLVVIPVVYSILDRTPEPQAENGH